MGRKRRTRSHVSLLIPPLPPPPPRGRKCCVNLSLSCYRRSRSTACVCGRAGTSGDSMAQVRSEEGGGAAAARGQIVNICLPAASGRCASDRPIYLLPAQWKHCSTRREQTRLPWEAQPVLFSPRLPATCPNSQRVSVEPSRCRHILIETSRFGKPVAAPPPRLLVLLLRLLVMLRVSSGLFYLFLLFLEQFLRQIR